MQDKMKDSPTASAGLEQRIALACSDLLVIQLDKEDDSDSTVRRLFEIITRQETPRLFALPLPESKFTEKHAFLQKVIVRLGSLHFKDVDLGANVNEIRRV
jgi:hypothetical protein